MGTSFAPASSVASAQSRPIQTTVSEPATEPEPLGATQPTTPIQQPPAASLAPEMVASPQTTKPSTPFSGIVAAPANVLVKNATTTKKKSLMPILFLVGGAIFFIAYAVIWAKIFGLF
jgi:hypothetical protein